MELLYKDLTGRTLGAAMQVHREIGAIEEAQMINYLKITMMPVGLIINLAGRSLEWKRLVLSEASPVDWNNPRNPRFQTRQQQSL